MQIESIHRRQFLKTAAVTAGAAVAQPSAFNVVSAAAAKPAGTAPTGGESTPPEGS